MEEVTDSDMATPGHSLPGTGWDYWQNKIRDVLGAPQGKSLRDTDLVHPWFLVPQHDELSEDEAADLFATVRRKLLGPTLRPRVLYAIRCVRNLRPEDSLPLLYAMRHVAREQGSIGRYWPAFHEKILDGQLELRDVQVRLASEVAQVWLRMYEHTRGALYYPREGRRYIKWPLAHAGLLRDDEEILRAFGSTLATEYGGDPSAAPLLPDDLDEFLLSLLDWLEQTGRFADSRLARLVRKKDGTDVTIGELAQRWLRDQWEQIAKEQDSRGASRARLVRRHLRYDAARHRVLLILRESVWPGDVEVCLHWGDLEVPIRTHFISVENSTECSLMEVPVLSPVWADNASLIAGEEHYSLRLPKPPENRGLVFRADDGRATRQWQLGEEYYVLLPDGQLRRNMNMADILFEEWVPLGPPDGEWDGYELLWVRTNDPLRVDSEKGEQTGVADVVAGLEEATERLRLPSFGHLWRPRLYLVGGARVRASGKEEAFAANAAPWLQARGIWDEMLPLTLTKWDEERGDFLRYATLELPPPRADWGQIVELWHDSVEAIEGRYRLEINSTPHSSFKLVPPPTPSDLRRFEVYLGIEGENGLTRTKGITRRDLEYGTLVGRAWPLAEITLVVSCGTWARTLLIRIDDEGGWRQRWRDMGVGGLPDGPVDVTLSWRGLAKAHLTFADVPFIAEGDIEVRWADHKQGALLEVAAIVSNRGGNRWARVVVLGPRPWDGQIWEQTVNLDEDGFLQARIHVERGKAHWLAILSPEPATSGSKQQPWVVEALSEFSIPWLYSLEDLSGEQCDTWQTLADQLREVSLPPGLHHLIGLSSLGLFLSEYSELRTLRPRWSALDKPGVLEQLTGWIPFDLQPQIVLFSCTPIMLRKSAAVLSPPFLTLFSLDELIRAMKGGGGEISLGCSAVDGSLRKVSSRLRVSRGVSHWHFEVHAKEWIYACSKCKSILPADAFWHHQPPIANLSPCTARNAMFTSHRPGAIVHVRPAILWDPGALLDCITTLILLLASGDESLIPPHTEPWLNELEVAYYGQTRRESEKDWLTGLAHTAQEVRRVFAERYEFTSKLIELGWLIDRYSVGLDALYRWLLSEMEWSNAASEPEGRRDSSDTVDG